MNFYTSNTLAKGKKGKKTSEIKFFNFWFVFKFLLISGLVFLVMNYRITLVYETEIMNRKANKIKTQLDEFQREINHLSIRKEELKDWSHISKNIRRFQIPIRTPRPYQVSELKLQITTDPVKDIADMDTTTNPSFASLF